MRKDDAVRLRHMLDATQEAMSFAQGRTRADLDGDRMLVLSLVKEIEIIGEAAYRISQATRDRLSGIPWDDLIGMRHRLVHAYFDINLDILFVADRAARSSTVFGRTAGNPYRGIGLGRQRTVRSQSVRAQRRVCET